MEEPYVVQSTKRPTPQRNTSKRQKREAQEGKLLEKAINLMETTSSKCTQWNPDDIFGEYIASELKTIKMKQSNKELNFKSKP